MLNAPFFKTELPKIENRLKSLLTFSDSPQNTLFEAARWAALSGGKRLRPLLLLATVDALKGDLEAALSPACALEMIHAYSLVHDDLPCMDDDDYRRGQLTVHKKYGEAVGVLSGDFLLTYAFEVLTKSDGLDPAQKLALIQILAQRAGGDGMIAGQILDLEAVGKPVSLEHLKLIHRKKTAEILTAALEMGGVIGKASNSVQSELTFFGQEIGLAFQIMDDVLDVTSSFEKHGKINSSDEINGKTTYVSHLGIEGAKEAAHALLHQSVNRLACLPDSQLLQSIATSFL